MHKWTLALTIALFTAGFACNAVATSDMPSTGESDPGHTESPAPEEVQDVPGPAVDVSFFLSDQESGEPRTAFEPDENIVFHYMVTNTTEATLQCEKSDGGPAVRFSLYREGRRVAHATEGLAFIQMIMLVKLEPGEHPFTSSRLAWEGFRDDPALQPGSYTARAEPVLRCPDLNFPDKTLDFSVAEE